MAYGPSRKIVRKTPPNKVRKGKRGSKKSIATTYTTYHKGSSRSVNQTSGQAYPNQ
jgi:hypothetical protein